MFNRKIVEGFELTNIIIDLLILVNPNLRLLFVSFCEPKSFLESGAEWSANKVIEFLDVEKMNVLRKDIYY